MRRSFELYCVIIIQVQIRPSFHSLYTVSNCTSLFAYGFWPTSFVCLFTDLTIVSFLVYEFPTLCFIVVKLLWYFCLFIQLCVLNFLSFTKVVKSYICEKFWERKQVCEIPIGETFWEMCENIVILIYVDLLVFELS